MCILREKTSDFCINLVNIQGSILKTTQTNEGKKIYNGDSFTLEWKLNRIGMFYI